jgi:hypothetical protein
VYVHVVTFRSVILTEYDILSVGFIFFPGPITFISYGNKLDWCFVKEKSKRKNTASEHLGPPIHET